MTQPVQRQEFEAVKGDIRDIRQFVSKLTEVSTKLSAQNELMHNEFAETKKMVQAALEIRGEQKYIKTDVHKLTEKVDRLEGVTTQMLIDAGGVKKDVNWHERLGSGLWAAALLGVGVFLKSFFDGKP